MSNPQYDYMLQLIAKQRMQQYIHEAEIDHLLSKMHPRGSSWWSRQACQPLRHLGHTLTNLGKRLENLDRPDAGSIRTQDAIGAATRSQ
ncbi:MAG: hypothetical protein WCF84_18590 [Anaerolineae bacterium]